MNSKPDRTLWWILGALMIVVCCCCLILLAAGGILFLPSIQWSSNQEPEPVITAAALPRPDDTAPMPTMACADLSPTEQELAAVVVPPRDLRRLAEGLRNTGPIPETVSPPPARRRVGDRETFWVSNSDSDEHFQIEAELVYENDVLYIWVQTGARYDLEDLQAAADRFARYTYPTNRNFFGSEWNPGIDGDPRLHILHSDELGSGIAGYFSGADAVSNLAQPFSNQREMFYIHLGNARPNSEFYNGVLAHEFQHMIHWYQDKNEATWVNEGMSELAIELNGYSRGGADRVFSELPDTQLNAWSDDPDGRTEHYGGAYLFMAYFLERFGNELTQAVVASPANDIEGINEALQGHDENVTFDDIFADWVIANYLDDPSLADGRYGYADDNLAGMAIDFRHRNYPAQRETTVHQYATDYIELRGSGDLQIDFQGATSTRLAPITAHSGQFVWWANRVDDSDARLTGAFDLSAVNSATLQFWTWYDIEDNWDYAYVMVSTDGGATWTPLPTGDAIDANPNGNSFGWALTGCSGDPASQQAGDDCNARWIEQTADLTPYTGQEVLLRFQYITDDAVNYPGFFVDDIRIPEIGYGYDAEQGDDVWQSEGWIRTDNRLCQRWLVQVIELERNQEPAITRLTVDENGRSQGRVTGLNRRKQAVLAVSALAPVTTELAPYEYSITEQ